MSSHDRLASLTRLQSLRERRERVNVERARSDHSAAEDRYLRSVFCEDEALQALEALIGASSLCLDRWRLSAGKLNHEAKLRNEAMLSMASATEVYDGARDRLHSEVMRSQELGDRTCKALRQFEAKRDEAKLRDVRSLRAALNGRTEV